MSELLEVNKEEPQEEVQEEDKKDGRRKDRRCTVEGCRKKHNSNGLCHRHYHQKYRKDQRDEARKEKEKEAELEKVKDIASDLGEIDELDANEDADKIVTIKAEKWFKSWDPNDLFGEDSSACQLYKRKVVAYIKDYPDLNMSADMTALHYQILEELRLNELTKKARENNSNMAMDKDYNTAIKDCVKNIENLSKMLATGRKDRDHDNKGGGGDMLSAAKLYDTKKKEAKLKEYTDKLEEIQAGEADGHGAVKGLDVSLELERLKQGSKIDTTEEEEGS